MFGYHHPPLTLKEILFLMKGCQEAMHPVPIVALFDLLFDHSYDNWLVCNLVHLIACSLIPQIESNDLFELDFQQQGSG